ncbi:MAG: ABC transporter ATP-binding protein [Phycisphaeraceae bacterium]|nr:ABC transporter ATP-binding protein [Phycisphaerales bacterium]MCB9842888.1 ABC transporter ATP-binding protein [Phycisphaeraceae bacterium]
MIVARDVHKSFGHVRAVRGVSFDIPTGQVVGILGPNGAGKSTTIRMLVGAMPPTSGSISVDNLDCVDHSRRVRQRLGYLPENNPIYPEMRVTEYLRFRAALYGITAKHRRAAVARVIERCWLTDMRSRRAGQLSKGYRQRLGLAASLIHNPPVLVLDEPTTGLDPSQIAETRRLVRELSGQRTMLIVSHILPEVEKTCDRILVFAGGTIRADGSPETLINQAAGPARIIVELKTNDRERARSVIASAPGVASAMAIDTDGQWTRVEATANNNADPREPIAGACAQANLAIRELTRERPSLERLYLRITEAVADELRTQPGADS